MRHTEQAKRCYERSGVPERHRLQAKKGVFDGSPKVWFDAWQAVLRDMSDGGLVAVIGTPGTGKTQIGEQAVRSASMEVRSCRYETAAEMFIAIRDCYGEFATRSESATLKEYTDPHLLVVDELDKIKSSDSEHRLLHLILDKRYRSLRPTLLLGNLDAEGLRTAIGDPGFERLVETGRYIELTGYTFRDGGTQ